MITHYNIIIKSTGSKLKVSYKGGHFFKIEKLTGKLTAEQVLGIGKIIPPLEYQIEAYGVQLQDKLSYRLIKPRKPTLYGSFVDEWMSFYDANFQIQPRFNAVDGKGIKSIIAYLSTISTDEQETLLLWKNILSNWKHLPKFFKDNPDIKFIYSQINKIINHVKELNQHTTAGQSASTTAENFRFGE